MGQFRIFTAGKQRKNTKCQQNKIQTIVAIVQRNKKFDSFLTAFQNDLAVYLLKIYCSAQKLLAHKAVLPKEKWLPPRNKRSNSMKITMNAPKILPWIARKAGISDELALKLWRRALSEAEYLSGKPEGSEYWGLAIERFLAIVEDEIGTQRAYCLTPAPRLSWMWHQQTRMSLLTLKAAENSYNFWQNAWGEVYNGKKFA
jgi:hypothetical protein